MTSRLNDRTRDRQAESDTAREMRRAAEHAKAQAERDEAIIGILRLMCDTGQFWRRCPERICRRNKRCGGGPDFACIRARPPSRATEQEKAAAIAELSAGLKARLRELEAAEQGGEAPSATGAVAIRGPARRGGRR